VLISRLTFVLPFAMLAAGCNDAGSTAAKVNPPPDRMTVADGGSGPPVVLKTRSETRQFRSWSATCSNDGACWAVGVAPEFEAGWIRIALRGGADAAPDVRFGFWPDSDAEAPSTLSLTIDGATYPASRVTQDDASVGVIRAPVRQVIDALAKAQSISINGAGGQVLSADGAAAAFLWIDEKQGRLGTTMALGRRGDRPASGIPGPPAPPIVHIAPPIDQAGLGDVDQQLPEALRRLPAVVSCIEDSSTPAVGDMVMSARLDARTELWAVPCGAGAYNVTHHWYLTGLDGRDPRPVDLAGSSATEGHDNTTVNGAYDPRTRLLSAFAQGRGIGDCGVMQTWAWAGSGFVLTQERLMTHCAGMPADLWPVSWTSRTD